MGGDAPDWRERAYQEAYEKELRGLRRRLEADPSCTAEELEGTLRNLYIMEGSDWVGRGEVQNITLAAAIAAHETMIDSLKTTPGRTESFRE
ncbi:MAG: hypothetical protein LBG84_09735 [Treponema sp.]|jgi:hypothetical protein|nr:hypothetical protein [Treponema sp.]